MSQYIAFEVVNNKTVRCVNIVANGNDWVCSLLECEREADQEIVVVRRPLGRSLMNIA
jgi:hypothetical protein